MWQASWKSLSFVQMRWNLIIWDFTIPLKVWEGWYEDLCSSSWVSVDLKYTFVSNFCVWRKPSPLNMVTSKKEMLLLSIFDLSFMFGWERESQTDRPTETERRWRRRYDDDDHHDSNDDDDDAMMTMMMRWWRWWCDDDGDDDDDDDNDDDDDDDN